MLKRRALGQCTLFAKAVYLCRQCRMVSFVQRSAMFQLRSVRCTSIKGGWLVPVRHQLQQVRLRSAYTPCQTMGQNTGQ